MRSSQYAPHAHPARSRLRDPGSQSPRPSRCCRCCSGSRCSQAGSNTSADALCLLGHVRSCYTLPHHSSPGQSLWPQPPPPLQAPTATWSPSHLSSVFQSEAVIHLMWATESSSDPRSSYLQSSLGMVMPHLVTDAVNISIRKCFIVTLTEPLIATKYFTTSILKLLNYTFSILKFICFCLL